MRDQIPVVPIPDEKNPFKPDRIYVDPPMPPTEPKPTEPKPTEPKPTEPKPTEPKQDPWEVDFTV